jgi:hypothetical protein
LEGEENIGHESKGTNSTDKTFNCLFGLLSLVGAPREFEGRGRKMAGEGELKQ